MSYIFRQTHKYLSTTFREKDLQVIPALEDKFCNFYSGMDFEPYLGQAFFCAPQKNSRGQKLKKLKTQEKNSKLKPKPQFSGIFQKILQIVYFLKRRYNLS